MNCFSELSEFEAAALEQAKKQDIRNMKSTVISSGMTDDSTKDEKITKPKDVENTSGSGDLEIKGEIQKAVATTSKKTAS